MKPHELAARAIILCGKDCLGDGVDGEVDNRCLGRERSRSREVRNGREAIHATIMADHDILGLELYAVSTVPCREDRILGGEVLLLDFVYEQPCPKTARYGILS